MDEFTTTNMIMMGVSLTALCAAMVVHYKFDNKHAVTFVWPSNCATSTLPTAPVGTLSWATSTNTH